VTIRLRAHAITRPAPGELVNEDAFVAEEAAGLFVVADGLAGRPAGEVASEVAVRAVSQALGDGAIDGVAPASLADALQRANDAVVARATGDLDLEGMAAAVTALRFRESANGRPASVELVHAGDCRAYLLRAGHLTMLTVDHLCVRGRTRVITKVLGRRRDVDPDTAEHEAHPGDRWLLCTDGLNKVVDDGEIQALLEDASDPVVAAGGLLDAARAAHTPDDVTIVVIDVGTPRHP